MNDDIKEIFFEVSVSYYHLFLERKNDYDFFIQITFTFSSFRYFILGPHLLNAKSFSFLSNKFVLLQG